MAEDERKLREKRAELVNAILDAEGDLMELKSAIEDRRYELEDLDREIDEKMRLLRSLRQQV